MTISPEQKGHNHKKENTGGYSVHEKHSISLVIKRAKIKVRCHLLPKPAKIRVVRDPGSALKQALSLTARERAQCS